MATGAFSTQAKEFFNSSIRTALEKALAESRGQIRALDVQNENQGAGTASIYAVVDQTYVNNKITTPQADVVRLTADLLRVGGVWKISDVTVLEGVTPASVGAPRARRARTSRGSSHRPAAYHAAGAACGSVVESRGQSQAKRPT